MKSSNATYAAKILKEHLTVFINFEEEMYEEEEEFDETDERLKKSLQLPLEDMELSVRTVAVIRSLDMRSVKDVVSKYEAIKIVIVEKGKDIFNFANHKKLAFYLEEKHQVKIEETEEDILFLE